MKGKKGKKGKRKGQSASARYHTGKINRADYERILRRRR